MSSVLRDSLSRRLVPLDELEWRTEQSRLDLYPQWEMAIDEHFAPRLTADTASHELDGHLLVAHPSNYEPLIIDPVTAVLVSWFDGRTTIEELAVDLSLSQALSLQSATTMLLRLVRELARDRYVAARSVPAPSELPARTFPTIPPDT